jgi:ribosome biogenesis ATPase
MQVTEGGQALGRSLQLHFSASIPLLACRGLAITMGDFRAAIARVQPSVRREGFTTTPDITWADVGSLAEARVFIARWLGADTRHPTNLETTSSAAVVFIM